MRVEDLDYDLPEEAIAQRPAPERDLARLLVCDVEPGGALLAAEERRVRELPGLLPARALVVLNETRVIPARLLGRRRGTGGAVELFLVEPLGDPTRFGCLARSSKPLRPGAVIELDGGLAAHVEGPLPADGGRLHAVRFEGGGADPGAALRAIGRVPLPPYVRRAEEPEDRARYQTVYARAEGSVAAPTAGLHFTPELLARLEGAGHELARLVLHVGLGTFLPVKTERLEDHPMHEERFEIPPAAADAVARARREGRPVVAVGTTVVRTLESSAAAGEVRAGAGATRLLIAPGHAFRAVDHLFTNFHMPRSTLLALVFAFASPDAVRAAYARALAAGFRFGSYGDAMLLRRRA